MKHHIARALVDQQLAWMVGSGRPSPQRADEEDGSEATFLVNDTHVVVYAADVGGVEIYCFTPGGVNNWSYTLMPGQELPMAARAHVWATLDMMGAQVRFPAPAWRTRWDGSAEE